MAFLIGIDTGGTYTDAVLLDEKKGVLAKAKSPTTAGDLAMGIRNSLEKLLASEKRPIALVSLSSTLATNAVVEGKGRPACLILIGYDDDILDHEMIASVREENRLFLVNGGHRISGMEQAPLDTQQLTQLAKENKAYVSSFAVSGYFSVRNPLHELKAKSILRNITDLPVTCGHELTSSLDAPRRAFTTLLNARLIPLLYELIRSVTTVLEEFGIDAPLMIVKGDGSLISSRTALDVPVETILSGPAASVAGARYLANETDALIIDMGGTTSDMAVLKHGHPAVSDHNPDIGGFRPMVESIDIFTKGIGGDSMITAINGNAIHAGPERVFPLCLLGQDHPEILGALDSFPDHKNAKTLPLFVYREDAGIDKEGLSSCCLEIVDRLNQGPVLVPAILNTSRYASAYEQSIRFLIKKGLVSSASFTPTDAAVLLDYYRVGSIDAASKAAEWMARRLDTDIQTLCRVTLAQVRRQLGAALIDCAVRSDNVINQQNSRVLDSFFIQNALQGVNHDLIACGVTLKCPIIALGAPAGTYLPEVAHRLNCGVIVPEHSDVANAIGAVTGTITQHGRAFIKPVHGGRSYTVHDSRGIQRFDRYDSAEGHAVEAAKEHAAAKGRAAGADHLEIKVSKHILNAGGGDSGQNQGVFIETEITATAIGRPRMAEYGGQDA